MTAGQVLFEQPLLLSVFPICLIFDVVLSYGQLNIMGMHNIQVCFTIALDLKVKKQMQYVYTALQFLATHGCIAVAVTVCAFELHSFPLCIFFLHISGRVVKVA